MISLIVSTIGALGMVLYVINRVFFRPKIYFREASCDRQEDHSYLFQVSYEPRGKPVEVIESLVAYPAADVLVISEVGDRMVTSSPLLSQSATQSRIGWQIHTSKSPIYLDMRTVAVVSFRFVPHRRNSQMKIEVILKARVHEGCLPWGIDMFSPMIKTISKIWEFDVESPPFDFRPFIQRGSLCQMNVSEEEWREIVKEAQKQATASG